MIFRVLETFYSEEMKNEYVKGFTYTVRNDLLRENVERWLKEGRVEVVKEPVSRINGTGIVV